VKSSLMNTTPDHVTTQEAAGWVQRWMEDVEWIRDVPLAARAFTDVEIKQIKAAGPCGMRLVEVAAHPAVVVEVQS